MTDEQIEDFGRRMMLPLSDDECVALVKEILAAAPVAGVPEGWKLVPVEPTEFMADAACPIGKTVDRYSIKAALRKAIAAAPTESK